MTTKLRLFPLLVGWLIVWLGASCVEDAPTPVPEPERKLVLSCVLSNTDEQLATLTWSKALGRSRFFDEVRQAHIVLYRDGVEVGAFQKSGRGAWRLEHRPKAGARYRIEVEVQGMPKLSAETTMPRGRLIKRKGTGSQRNLHFLEAGGVQTPYWFFVLESSIHDPLKVDLHNPPKLAEDKKASLMQRFHTDHPRADRFNFENFVDDVDRTQDASLLTYKHYVRVPAPDPEEPKGGRDDFALYHRWARAIFLVFRYCSHEYDRYLKSIMEKKFLHEGEDNMAARFDESRIYNNIHNGLGIFGAYHQDEIYDNLQITTIK